MQRPTSVTVFGILNLVFGGLGICGVVFSAAMFAVPQNPNMPNPVLDLMKDNAVYAAFTQVSLALGFLAKLVLLAAGVGLLQLKPWGRLLSIGYGVYAIVMGIVGLVVNCLFLVVPLMNEAAHLAGPEKAGAIGGVIGGTFGGCLGLVYPVILLIFMYRSNVVMAFQRPQTAEFL